MANESVVIYHNARCSKCRSACDIIAALGNSRAFHRLRIGIGHPGAREKVSPHVLSRPSPADRRLIDLCIEEALHVLPDAVSGNWPIAMNRLNSFRAE